MILEFLRSKKCFIICWYVSFISLWIDVAMMYISPLGMMFVGPAILSLIGLLMAHYNLYRLEKDNL